MITSDTPETDAETIQDEMDHVDSDIGPFAPSNTVCADFARKLERERDEARSERDKALREIAAARHEAGFWHKLYKQFSIWEETK